MDRANQFKLVVYFNTGPGETGRTFYCRTIKRARFLIGTRYYNKYRTALLYAPDGTQLEKWVKGLLQEQQKSA